AICDRGKRGADRYPEELIPIEERHADQRRLGFIVEWWPENRDELHEEEQVPPAPPPTLPLRSVHCSSLEWVVSSSRSQRSAALQAKNATLGSHTLASPSDSLYHRITPPPFSHPSPQH